MAKIVVGSPSLTQPLLYPGLGPAMSDNIGGVFYLDNKREKELFTISNPQCLFTSYILHIQTHNCS
jgi:hypothetical protein